MPRFFKDLFAGLVTGTFNGQQGWAHTTGIYSSVGTPAFTAAGYATTGDSGGNLGDFDGAAKNANGMAGLDRAKPFDVRLTFWLKDQYDNGSPQAGDTPPYFVVALGGDVVSGTNVLLVWVQYKPYDTNPNAMSVFVEDQSSGTTWGAVTLTPATNHTLRLSFNTADTNEVMAYLDDVCIGCADITPPSSWDDASITLCLYGKADPTENRVYGLSVRSIDRSVVGTATGTTTVKGTATGTVKLKGIA